MGAPTRIAWCLVLGGPLALGTVTQPAQALRENVPFSTGLWSAPASVTGLLRSTPDALRRREVALTRLQVPAGSTVLWPQAGSPGPAAEGTPADTTGFAYSLGREASANPSRSSDLMGDGLTDGLLDPAAPAAPAAASAALPPLTSPGDQALLAEVATVVRGVEREVFRYDPRSMQEKFMASEVMDFMSEAMAQNGIARQCLDRASYSCGGPDLVNGKVRPEAVDWTPVNVEFRPSAIEGIKRQR